MSYPSWNQVKRSQDLYLEMRERRLIPGQGGDFMGELRSLVHNEWSGGEHWRDWAKLFEQQPPSVQQQGMDYLAQHWHWPQMSRLEDVSEAMMHRAMVKGKAIFEANALWENAPPAKEEELQEWETEHGAIPYTLRRFLLDFTAGQPEPEEDMYFFFGETDFEDETGLPLFFTVEAMVEEFQRSGQWPDEHLEQWITRMAQVIEHGEAQQEYDQASTLPVASDDTKRAIEQALVMHVYFEGNHGDSVTIALRDDVYDGQMLTIEDVMHGDLAYYTMKKHGVTNHAGDPIRPNLKSPFQGWLEALGVDYYMYQGM